MARVGRRRIRGQGEAKARRGHCRLCDCWGHLQDGQAGRRLRARAGVGHAWVMGKSNQRHPIERNKSNDNRSVHGQVAREIAKRLNYRFIRSDTYHQKGCMYSTYCTWAPTYSCRSPFPPLSLHTQAPPPAHPCLSLLPTAQRLRPYRPAATAAPPVHPRACAVLAVTCKMRLRSVENSPSRPVQLNKLTGEAARALARRKRTGPLQGEVGRRVGGGGGQRAKEVVPPPTPRYAPPYTALEAARGLLARHVHVPANVSLVSAAIASFPGGSQLHHLHQRQLLSLPLPPSSR